MKPILQAAGVADQFEIMAPREATRASLETITSGENTIAITGNVLRDYLTDLFPILELATSAKMLSIVKLMQGGGLFETGAGGSAPKHVQQLQAENHLRWDSLGEFCALGESLKFLAQRPRQRPRPRAGRGGGGGDAGHPRSWPLAKPQAGRAGQPRQPLLVRPLLGRGAGGAIRRRGAGRGVRPGGQALADGEAQIVDELAAAQGRPADTGGYYHPDDDKLAAVMRPSATLNAIIG